MKHIKDLLEETEKLDVIETGVKPIYEEDKNIKAIIFDIYGTLLISSSGDIDQAEMDIKSLKKSLVNSNFKISDNGLPEKEKLEQILNIFQSNIKTFHEEKRKKMINYPEIDVIDIWQKSLELAKEKKLIEKFGNLKDMILEFELHSNKVYPMPNMLKTIKTISEKKYPMGIISNAQFYTPVILNYFINKDYKENTTIQYFNSDLIIYSYKELKAKPEVSIFNKLLNRLSKQYQIIPSEVAFVGNDMFKDIYPARKAGMKTILFAGDKRSLRWRDEKTEVKNIKPDHVITDLKQLLSILS